MFDGRKAQRADLASPPHRIEIDHGHGMAAFAGAEIVAALQAQPAMVAGWPPIPDLTSILSAEPAVLYRCGDLAIPLTGSECGALLGGDLTPDEIARLELVFGPAWEWGETFYASNGRHPVQPQGLRTRILQAGSRVR